MASQTVYCPYNAAWLIVTCCNILTISKCHEVNAIEATTVHTLEHQSLQLMLKLIHSEYHNVIQQDGFFEDYKFCRFCAFWDFHEICFTENQQKFYCGSDCRLKRRHQRRFVKIVSSNFLFSLFVKFVAFSKKAPYSNNESK